MVKNPPAMQETWVQSLGWEHPLEEEMQLTPVFLPGESPWTEEPSGLHGGHKELDMTEQLSTIDLGLARKRNLSSVFAYKFFLKYLDKSFYLFKLVPLFVKSE